MFIFGHKIDQYAGGGWKRNHWLRHHVYPTPRDVKVKDAVAFVFDDLMQHDVQNKREGFPGYLHPLFMSDERGRADDSVSRNINIVGMAGKGEENSALGVCPDSSIDAQIEYKCHRKFA